MQQVLCVFCLALILNCMTEPTLYSIGFPYIVFPFCLTLSYLAKTTVTLTKPIQKDA